mmetsp:Transcript_13289/g.40963  ORF Transcript_13289/g.40963 Transcript_13289/m.40963 type:complete len:235 (-) Transcript_13289:53-757(-)
MNYHVRYTATPLRAETHGSRVVAVCAGYTANILLCDDGTCLVSGENSEGELGLGDHEPCRDRFRRLDRPAGENIIKASTTMLNEEGLHTLFLTSAGTCFGCGNNEGNQLIFAGEDHYTSPIRLMDSGNVEDVCAGEGVSFVATRDGGDDWKLRRFGKGQYHDSQSFDCTVDINGPVIALVSRPVGEGENVLAVTSPRDSAEHVYEWIHAPDVTELNRLHEVEYELVPGPRVQDE